ncbi:MAG: hypothetical protein ACPG5P_02810, partial [Saprospiraceae bacterium]
DQRYTLSSPVSNMLENMESHIPFPIKWVEPYSSVEYWKKRMWTPIMYMMISGDYLASFHQKA